MFKALTFINKMESKTAIIPGYTHPTTNVVNRGTQYKTFTEGQKAKKKEKFGTTTTGTIYGDIGTVYTKKEEDV